MSIIDKWNEKLESKDAAEFYNTYLETETSAYKAILGEKNPYLQGSVEELSGRFNMEDWVFAGFIDGINTSLKEKADVEALESDTVLDCEIDFHKLYYNMLNAKAQWLYTLDEWDGIMSKEERADIKKQFTIDHTAVRDKVGRNDPCPCGSGKKYKKCCGQ
ncbi:MAG: SEC-C metal-binding domain-containing protein [Clostridia bacterium]|jgi:hypothetical protein|nr:SEC-C domain-containing protein [Clostridia bacterium]NLV33286.1 SEC-C domain-containing protein [Clostridiaceae bacterium]MDD4501632.1 SEC-C metal-binding domain-containing protein [Clostridia bacterium]HPB16157.1 SEC-C metal-binding domain-containing protein [Clostridia bacterium]HQM96277.1 SEC-C metal-binding domain-containing protein [Clostridia bacterium]